jgi:cytochrome c oxidase subunit 3
MSTDSSGVLAHHFDNMEQQQSAARLGMWMFLVTEVLFFGGIFVAYTAYRIWYPEAYLAGSSKLNLLVAAINSFLLVTSSLFMTYAIHAAHEKDQAGLKRYLLLTLALATIFIGLKGREYYIDYEEHLIPGRLFNSPAAGEHESPAQEFEKKGFNAGHVQLFFMFYYCMTGIHVLHMVVGMGLIVWLYFLANKGYFQHSERYVYIEVMSLYWHFVDMMWFFLVAVLYAAGPHPFNTLHF